MSLFKHHVVLKTVTTHPALEEGREYCDGESDGDGGGDGDGDDDGGYFVIFDRPLSCVPAAVLHCP